MLTLKLRLFLIFLGGFLLNFVACTPPTPPPSPTPWPTPTSLIEATLAPTATPLVAPEPEPTPTLPVTTLIIWENLPEPQIQALTEDIQAFHDQFPQFTIILKHYDNPENFMTPLAAGQLEFDVVLASPVLLGSLWSGKQVAPMSDFFGPVFIDSFASVTLLGASQDNELWGLPDTAGFHLLLFYNQDLVDIPPTNTDQLFDQAQSLTQGSQPQPAVSQWGLGLNSYDPLWLIPWLAPYGGSLTGENGQPTLNTPAMEAAITLYLGWHGRLNGDTGQIALAPLETYARMREQFLQGDMAMMIDGEWAITELAQAKSKISWRAASLPEVSQAGENQPAAPLVLARYWAVSRTVTGNRTLAVAAFLSYITQPERQLAWTSQFGLLPTRRQALDDPIIINDSALRTSAAQMQAGQVVPLGTNANTILNAMRDPLREALEGKLTPSEAAQAMQINLER